LSSSIFASYQAGKKTNRDTHNDIDFTSFAARLSSYFFRYFSLDFFFNRYHMDNDVPDGIERDVERGGLDISALVKKKTSIKFSYQWHDIDRDNFSQGSTYKEIYRMTLNHRPFKKLRLHLKYEKTKIRCRWQTAYTQLLSFPRKRESISGAITMFTKSHTKSQNRISSLYIILLLIIPKTIRLITCELVFQAVPEPKLRCSRPRFKAFQVNSQAVPSFVPSLFQERGKLHQNYTEIDLE